MAKPSPTGVSKEKLKDLLAELGEWLDAHHTATTSRLFQRLYDEDIITFNELIFIDIDNWMRAFRSGAITVEDANAIHSKHPDQFVLVPLEYMDAISAHWNKYISGPSGKSFGEVLGFDGGGQGGQNTRERVKYCIRDLDLVGRVVTLRRQYENAGNAISLDAAYTSVVDEMKNDGKKVGVATVRRAYKNYGEFIIEELKRNGLID